MKDLLLTQSGDLYFDESGDIKLTDSVSQAILVRLRWFWEEWRFSPEFGVPYFEEFLVKNPNLNYIRQLIREQIASVKEVTGIPMLDITFDKSRRELKIIFTATTQAQEIKEEVLINAQMGNNSDRV